MVDLTSKIAASTEAARRQMGREVWGGGGGGGEGDPIRARSNLRLEKKVPSGSWSFFLVGGGGGKGYLS